MGNKDGTFGSEFTAAYGYFDSAAIANGDFNKDGNEDLVFGSNPVGPPTHLQVRLGKGNGKFSKGPRFGHFVDWPFGLTVGDFDRDGKLDLAATTGCCALAVFLGQGDGNFVHKGDYDELGNYEVQTADFSGDGILDLAVVRGTGDGGLHVRLGNGDGTFQASRVVDSNPHLGCSFGPVFFVTDFNGDGKADLAYCERDSTNGKLWIALGKGDGKFKKPTSIPIANGIFGFSFTVGDFNSDGKTDLLVNYLISDTQSETDLYLGNGNGTFQNKKVISIGSGPHEGDLGIVPADFNSDGLLDFIIQDPGQVVVLIQK